MISSAGTRECPVFGDIQSAIIAIDTLGTRTAIAGQIIQGGGGDVSALKGNRGTLHEGVIDDSNEQVGDDFANIATRRYSEDEKGRGRQETRTYLQCPVPPELTHHRRWQGLRIIGVIFYQSACQGRETSDVRYYMSSLRLGVNQFAKAVRQHWALRIPATGAWT